MNESTYDPQVIELVGQVLSLMGLEYTEIKAADLHGTRVFAIQTKDSAKLIGSNGESLHAFNTLIKRLLERKVPQDVRIMIDVNGYNSQKVRSLEDQARVVAERAKTFKYDIDMPAMSAYERMIVHSALKEIPGITTRSEGEGPLRHIVVSYKESA